MMCYKVLQIALMRIRHCCLLLTFIFKLPFLFFAQDIAASIDEEDVAKFTDVVKEFDSMTPLVYSSHAFELRSNTCLLSIL